MDFSKRFFKGDVKMNRLTLVTILISKIANSEDRLERLSLALNAIEKLENENTESYLRRYYNGLE